MGSGRGSRRVNVVIMTAPPRDTTSLKASLAGANIVEAVDTQHRGSFWNAITAFAIGVDTGGPFTILQDDILVCRDFVSYVERLLPTIEVQEWIVNWFNVTKPVQPTVNPVLVWCEPREFYYSQAVTYSSWSARRIYEFLVNEARPEKDDRGQNHGDDQWIRAALEQFREPYLSHLPSLVQHTGQESMVAPGMKLSDHQRVSRNFIGTDFDVMKWPRII